MVPVRMGQHHRVDVGRGEPGLLQRGEQAPPGAYVSGVDHDAPRLALSRYRLDSDHAAEGKGPVTGAERGALEQGNDPRVRRLHPDGTGRVGLGRHGDLASVGVSGSVKND